MDNIEFSRLDLARGFVSIPKRPRDIIHKVLTDTMDDDEKTDMQTRILRIDFEIQSFGKRDHPYCEDLPIIQGSLYDGEPGEAVHKLVAPAFACRTAGHMHGPARTDDLCYIIELEWYH